MELDIGGGFKIRSFEAADVDSIVKYANDRRVWLTLRDLFPHPYTEEDALNWLQKVSEDDPEVNFAIASPAEVIGGIGVTLQSDIHRLTGEIGYWLGEPFWGRGISTRAVKAFTEYTFSAFDIVRVYAYVFSNNRASTRVLEKAGYVREGCLRKSVIKDGRILDMWVYAQLRED